MKGFEEKLGHLEKIAEQMRDRDLPLEKAMALFEEGVTLSRGLEDELEGFERKVEVLANAPAEDGSGEAELKPF
jgi:exodeoxyribonuclease VII small subunit